MTKYFQLSQLSFIYIYVYIYIIIFSASFNRQNMLHQRPFHRGLAGRSPQEGMPTGAQGAWHQGLLPSPAAPSGVQVLRFRQ